PACVGPALPSPVAPAVLYGHALALDRPRVVGRGAPDQPVLGSPFEVDGEVRDKRSRGNVHRRGRTKEWRAEARALELDNVEPRLTEWDADHLERVRTARLRQGELAARALVRAEDRRRAPRAGDTPEPRHDIPTVGRRDPQDCRRHALEELTQHAALVALGPEHARANLWLQPTQRDREHRVGALHDAEARGERREWRKRRW